MRVIATRCAQHLIEGIGAKRIRIERRRFSSGEHYIRIKEDLAGEKVCVVAKIMPCSDDLMETLLILDALTRQKATISLLIPYLAYAREDRIVKPGEALGAQVLCQALRAFKCNRISIMDAHSPLIKTYLKFDDILPYAIFRDIFAGKIDALVVAPDSGAVRRADMFARMIGADVAYLKKERKNHVRVLQMLGEVDIRGRDIIIIDDIIDTGDTIIKASRFLKRRGCGDIWVAATHGIFSKDALPKLGEAPIRKIFVTDTLIQRKSKMLNVVSVKPLIRQMLKYGRINLS